MHHAHKVLKLTRLGTNLLLAISMDLPVRQNTAVQ